ncbi:transcriptional regulator, MerR family [Pseudomonas asplenii]|uniref:Transcriptional regulator, MerR family n=1 Tax=Pseudomonas asplenii TaxID=53407 RepID=A0A1H6P486_9PSED|nr:MerR family transcriptional regulator [Pseudomonas fuscovaginae]SEI18802.1 transcriptional regulator, MerR family [Pseudomonas fuscovaginae]
MYIGKAAQLSGTTVKTIRHYEDIGLLPPPRREGKYRVYSQQSVELLTFIKCAQQSGFKLKEMQAILEDHHGQELPWEVARKAIADKKQELMTQIQGLQKIHAGLEAFESIYESLPDSVAPRTQPTQCSILPSHEGAVTS